MLDCANRAHSDPNNKNTRKPWKYILLDSIIIGGIAMGAVMPAMIPTIADLWVMAKGFLIAFLVQLAVERGLKRKGGD